ncbi:hypothetical protein [Shimia sediminis]|uniref:hypothetical protein n=1 Tax=Shimia sediminis TaxID=2497945 RepID=UPI0013DF168C|nr:hypothetical protein [Shimia sediminis]
MGRVLPFIFVTTGLVAIATFQAQSERMSNAPAPLTMAGTISVESLAPAPRP